jgi:hypothetical protein
MRKVVTALLLSSLFGIAHAETDKSQLFDCMDNETFELNSQCIANNIDSNVAFRDAQTTIINTASESSEYVSATMKFYPEQMLIEIVAHRDALQANRLRAKNFVAKR